jgi:hypothetical protein
MGRPPNDFVTDYVKRAKASPDVPWQRAAGVKVAWWERRAVAAAGQRAPYIGDQAEP